MTEIKNDKYIKYCIITVTSKRKVRKFFVNATSESKQQKYVPSKRARKIKKKIVSHSAISLLMNEILQQTK